MSKLVMGCVVLGLSVAALGRLPAGGPLEPMHVLKIEQSGNFFPPTNRLTPDTTITVKVQSWGCTRPDNFVVAVVQDGGNQKVSIHRRAIDVCEGDMRWEEMDLETKAIALSTRGLTPPSRIERQNNPIVIQNPLPVEDHTSH